MIIEATYHRPMFAHLKSALRPSDSSPTCLSVLVYRLHKATDSHSQRSSHSWLGATYFAVMLSEPERQRWSQTSTNKVRNSTGAVRGGHQHALTIPVLKATCHIEHIRPPDVNLRILFRHS